jgi:hypothetical protein
MDMRTESYIALFDELEKIAEGQNRFVDKEKFKRHLKSVAVAGAGGAVGAGIGSALKHAYKSRKGPIGEFVRTHPKAALAATVALSGLGALGGAAQIARTRQHFKQVEKQ